MAIVSRGIVGTLILFVGLLIAAACAPAAQPTPAAAPTKPAPTAAAVPAGAPKPTPEPGWKVEWEKVLAAAKKEGKVVVSGPPGDAWRNASVAFQKVYPEITLEFSGGQTSGTLPKILGEREAGLYLWDVHVGGAGSAILDFIPNKAVAPLRPALILPEVLDDTKWQQGFDYGLLDANGRYVYGFLGYLSFSALVNREVAPEAELKTHDDLLDPKWKGKIAWDDPRSSGSGRNAARQFFYVKGEDWLRKLLAQDIVILKDPRMMMEGLVRGRYSVAIGTRAAEEEDFRRAGLADHLKSLDPDGEAGAYLTSGSGSVMMFDRAPHPNAAKVYINWLLSKEGQEGFVRETGSNSRRLDVESPPASAPKAGIKYIHSQREDYVKQVESAHGVIAEALK